ncbi:hypothetical protein GCM10009794_12940 [Rothia terrae]
MDAGTLLQALAIMTAGFGAGFINVIVGSGTLITFPILLMFDFPALTANMSNSIGLVAGNLSGVWGYRREIAAQKKLALKLLPASIVGGATGALYPPASSILPCHCLFCWESSWWRSPRGYNVAPLKSWEPRIRTPRYRLRLSR